VQVREIEVVGRISNLTGACPTLKFTVDGRVVFTTMSTTFQRGSCAALTNDDPVTVNGWLMSDNTVRADRVRIER